MTKDKIPMDRKDLIKEHEKLIRILRSPSHEDDKKEAKDQSKELAGYKDAKSSSKMAPKRFGRIQTFINSKK